MLKKQVEIGGVYRMKVSGKIVDVKITHVASYGGGWFGENLTTGREVRVKTAGKLRRRVESASEVVQRAQQQMPLINNDARALIKAALTSPISQPCEVCGMSIDARYPGALCTSCQEKRLHRAPNGSTVIV